MEKSFIIGFDQGFSSIKVSTDWGDFKFPNAIEEVSRAGTIGGDFLGGNNIKTYFYNGKYYLVGQEVKNDKNYNRQIDYLLKYAPVFLACAIDNIKELYNITVDHRFIISAGLPIEYNTHAKEYRKILSRFTVDNKTYQFDNIKINGQGVGVFADYVYNWGRLEPDLRNEEGVILDIGENTIIVVHYKNGSILKEGTEQFTKYGVSSLMDKLGDTLKRKFNGRVFNVSEIRKAFLSKSILQAGKVHDITDIVDSLQKDYIVSTLNFLINKYGDLFLSINKIILAGGGGILLNDFMKNVDMSDTGNFIVSPSSEYSNSRGYLAISKRK